MTETTNFRNRSILVVEDSKLLRGLLRDVLRAFNFRMIKTLPSAEDALEWLRQNNVDLILTDWLMEGMAGVDLVREIRTKAPEPTRRLSIILCTAYTDKKRIFTARDAGVDEILAKPLTAARMYDTIHKALEHRRLFIDEETYIGPDRRRRQMRIDFPDRRGADAKRSADGAFILD